MAGQSSGSQTPRPVNLRSDICMTVRGARRLEQHNIVPESSGLRELCGYAHVCRRFNNAVVARSRKLEAEPVVRVTRPMFG